MKIHKVGQGPAVMFEVPTSILLWNNSTILHARATWLTRPSLNGTCVVSTATEVFPTGLLGKVERLCLTLFFMLWTVYR